MFKQSSFLVLLTALLSATVHAQSRINFQACALNEDVRDKNDGSDFADDISGSQRRTYGNLCNGSKEFESTDNTDTDISSRNADPFRRFCDLIDRHENVRQLMATGNSPHTVFAPTDAAFAKIDGLLPRLSDQRLLELHILGQARLKRDLRCGQTYKAINTRQDRRNTQRSRTECISGGKANQLGAGNVVNGLKPTIGNPPAVFNRNEFQAQTNFEIVVDGTDTQDDIDTDKFSADVVSCNGVIHVVDEVLLPGSDQVLQTGYYNAQFAGPGHSHTGVYGVPHSHGGTTGPYHGHGGFGYYNSYGIGSPSLYYNPFGYGFRKKK